MDQVPKKKQKQRNVKHGKPSKTDKSIFEQYGLTGGYAKEEFFKGRDTINFDTLKEKSNEKLSEQDAMTTLGLFVKYGNDVPKAEWDRAVATRMPGNTPKKKPPTTMKKIVIATDDMEIDKIPDEVILPVSSPKIPLQISWNKFEDIKRLPSEYFCEQFLTEVDEASTRKFDSRLEKIHIPQEWDNIVVQIVGGKYFDTIPVNRINLLRVYDIPDTSLFVSLFLQRNPSSPREFCLHNYFYIPKQ